MRSMLRYLARPSDRHQDSNQGQHISIGGVMSKKPISSSIVKWGLLGAFLFWRANAQGDSDSNSSLGLEIISPSHPMTIAACECPKMAQRLSWDGTAATLKGKISYSTIPGVATSSGFATHLQTFVLSFPTVCRSTHDELYVETDDHELKLGYLKKLQSGRLKVQLDPGVNFIAHRVQGRLGGEIIISPSACKDFIH